MVGGEEERVEDGKEKGVRGKEDKLEEGEARGVVRRKRV